MKRKALATLLTLAMVATLAGCNTASPMAQEEEPQAQEVQEEAAKESSEEQNTAVQAEAEPITIQFWNAFTGTDGDVLREIVDQYNEENDKGITIEMDIMPAASLEEKLPAAIASKTAPALIIRGNFDTATYTNNGIISPLDDFFEVTGTDKGNFNEAPIEALQYNGSQMMIPMQVHSTFLYWNKELFEAAGLDPETPPATWDEVAEYAGKVADPSRKIYGVGFPISGAPSYFNAMFKANGGDVFSEDGTKSVLDSAENLKTLEYIQGLVKEGYAPVGSTGADTDNLMLAGQMGIYCSGPWLINGLREAEIDFGVTGMPAGDERAAGVIEVQGFAVTSTSSEAEKAAAYDFIAYWNTDRICKEWSMRNGFPPYLKSLAEDADLQADEIVNALSSISDFGFSFAPGVTVVKQVNGNVLFPMIENVVAGNDPQDELTKASASIDEILAK
ncbi:ABC transporter substrate-binding protein [Kineothrix sp. MB12-C1]|uniref:ABC transporter substrate-binding protein n=1 Tax=Kineothrix sp. MB12-C1 TaxID=3070215 RepID=UPI0027D306BA|nr:ABC transporter substrate-binding protein [Kineothrix sp. MB12-C1]WMC91573.1 ABC transporter substrate-binding protein [Kineothrix sp. MB12-C1]